MSAVAALAVASPVAGAILSGASSTENAAPQQREFVQATLITDLPNELLGALSQGLSQFGINLPPLPTGVLTGSGAPSSTTLTSPRVDQLRADRHRSDCTRPDPTGPDDAEPDAARADLGPDPTGFDDVRRHHARARDAGVDGAARAGHRFAVDGRTHRPG